MNKPLKKSYGHGFIGFGKMAEAILRGMLRSGLAKSGEILVSRTSPEALKKIKKNLKIDVTTDNAEVASRCRHLWLGVKPFHAAAVLAGIEGRVKAGTPVISFVTGISSDFLRARLKAKLPIVRLMPNTPCLLGAGMTGVYFGAGTQAALRARIAKIVQSLGDIEIVKQESELDAVTGLSGSGPAFVYLVAQGLVAGGTASGLKPHQAARLAFRTLAGAARMLEETGRSAEELIVQVATKGGTTEAGLQVLAEDQVADALSRAVEAAARRAREIRGENDRCTP